MNNIASRWDSDGENENIKVTITMENLYLYYSGHQEPEKSHGVYALET